MDNNKDSMEFLRRSDEAKRTVAAKAKIHQNYYAGDQAFMLDEQNSRIVRNPRIRIAMNVSGGVIDVVHASMMARQMELQCAPQPTGDSDDRWAADVGSAVLKDHERRNRGPERLDLMAHQLLITGTEFMRVGFDPTLPATQVMSAEEAQMWEQMVERATGRPMKPIKMRTLSDGRMELTYPVGGTTEQWCSGLLVFVESGRFGGSASWDDIHEFMVVNYPSLREMKNKYPTFSDRIEAITVKDIRGASFGFTHGSGNYNNHNSQTSDYYTSSQEICWEVEHWVKQGNSWACRVMTNKNMELTLLETTYPANPYFCFRCNPTGRFWGKGLYNDMRQPQFACNMMMSNALSYLSKTIKDVLLIPFGAETSPITSDHHLIVKYDSMAGAPQVMRVDHQILQIYHSLANDFIDKIMRLGRVPAVAQGETNQRLAGRAIQELQDQWSTSIQKTRQHIGFGLKKKGELVLRMAQEEYGEYRLRKLMGSYSESLARYFKEADVLGGSDVNILEVDNTDRSKSQREDKAVQLAAIQGYSPAIIDQFVKHGTLSPPTPVEESEAERRAESEWLAIKEQRVTITEPTLAINHFHSEPDSPMYGQMRSVYVDRTDEIGMMVPLFDPLQLHDIDVQVHTRQLSDPKAPEWAKKILRFHLQAEHELYLSLREQSAFEAQIEQESRMSIAQQAGTLQSTTTSQILDAALDGNDDDTPKPKGSPYSGGKKSGQTRANKARQKQSA